MITLKISIVIAQDYYSLRILVWWKTKDVYKNFSKHKDMFDFSNHLAKSKYYDDLNKLVFG